MFDLYNSRFIPRTPFGESLPRRETVTAIRQMALDGVTKAVWVRVFSSILMSRGFMCTMRPVLSKLTENGGALLHEILDGRYADWLVTKPEAKLRLDDILSGARPRDWLAPPLEPSLKDHHPKAYCETLKRLSPQTVSWLHWRFDGPAAGLGQHRAAAGLLRGSVLLQPHAKVLAPLIEEIYGPNGTYWSPGSLLPG